MRVKKSDRPAMLSTLVPGQVFRVCEVPKTTYMRVEMGACDHPRTSVVLETGVWCFFGEDCAVEVVQGAFVEGM